MKRKIIICAIAVFLICILAAILIPMYKIDQMFTYDIDKEKGEVTITGYLGDNRARDRYNTGEEDQLIFPKKIEIPKTIKGYPVTAIGDGAFNGAMAEEIVLPDTVKSLGNVAFCNCENLKSIKGLNNVEIIGYYALASCKELQELYMPNLKTIGEGGFSDDDKLQEIIIPDTMKILPGMMCFSMASLTNVDIPEGVEIIQDHVFTNCDSLEEVYIPASVTEISQYAFGNIEEQITIVGVKGSYAEEYALEMGIVFREVD